MKVADIKISGSLLRQLLCLPEDTEILDARAADKYFGDIVLRVSHPGLRDVEPGECVWPANPEISRRAVDLGYGEVWMPHFEGWGQ